MDWQWWHGVIACLLIVGVAIFLKSFFKAFALEWDALKERERQRKDRENAPTPLGRWLAAHPPPPGKTFCDNIPCLNLAEYQIMDGSSQRALCEEHAQSLQERIERGRMRQQAIDDLPIFPPGRTDV